jgi:hypothetical protein
MIIQMDDNSQYTIKIIIPFGNKPKSFQRAGYDVKESLNLIDKDVLVHYKETLNGKEGFKFFSLRQCVTDPKLYHYYSLHYNHEKGDFYITPAVKLEWKRFKNSTKPPTLRPVPVTLWEKFPDCIPASEKHDLADVITIDYKSPEFRYDASILFNRIQEFIATLLAPPQYSVQ